MNYFLVLLVTLTCATQLNSQLVDEETDDDLIKEFIDSAVVGLDSDSDFLSGENSEDEIKLNPIAKNPPPAPLPNPSIQDLIKPIGGTSNEGVITEDAPCECVKYFLCNVDNGTIIHNGDVLGLIDIRLGGTKQSPCPHYFDICCKNLKSEPEQIPPAPVFNHSVCGKRNIGGVGFRITGAYDGEAQFGEFPWMAAIVRQENQGGGKPPLNIFVCGGSLIHSRVVMTAAHCVFGRRPSELKVRLGEWDTQTLDELYPHLDRKVEKVAIKEDYYAGALYNDIALLFLQEDVTFAPNIDTVCLPSPTVNFDGQRCFASGWGKDSFGQEGKYQVILKRIDLPLVPAETCQRALRTTRLGLYFKLHDSFVCAGGEKGKDTCRGDGGSPLVCQLPGSSYYVQVGIVAWGIGCGDEGIPGVYVNVQKFVPWIKDKFEKVGLEPKYFEIS